MSLKGIGRRIGGGSTKAKLTVEAKIYEPKTLFFREGAASAKTPDGKEYEVSQMGGSIFVRLERPEGGVWLVISPQAFLNAYMEQIEGKTWTFEEPKE